MALTETVRSRWDARETIRGMVPGRLEREGEVLDVHIREGRFQRGLAFVAAMASLLSGLEVTYEHYRGSYSQRVMYTPVLLSVALTLAGIGAVFSRWAARILLPIASLLTVVDGAAGFYFHVRGVARKPGDFRVPVMNVIMGPPLLAPLLFALSGYLGFVASLLRREDDPDRPRRPGSIRFRPALLALMPGAIGREGLALQQQVREGRFQKHIAVVAGLTALFSGFEAYYSHYKNGFAYRASQWSPIVLAPILFAAGVGTVWSKTVARTLLPVSSVLMLLDGGLGFYFHARGVVRRPGGIRLPVYNVIYGPPIFAPLLLAASGFMGILASLLRRSDT